MCMQATIPSPMVQLWRDWWRNILVISYRTSPHIWTHIQLSSKNPALFLFFNLFFTCFHFILLILSHSRWQNKFNFKKKNNNKIYDKDKKKRRRNYSTIILSPISPIWFTTTRSASFLGSSGSTLLPTDFSKTFLIASFFLHFFSASQYLCYISFLLSSFYQLSQCSDSAPNIYFTLYWLFFHMLHFSHLYLFPVSSVFLLFPTFTCTPIYPSICFHLSFHVLWLCSQPFPSYYSEGQNCFHVFASATNDFITQEPIIICIWDLTGW